MRKDVDKFKFGVCYRNMATKLSEDEFHDYIVAHRWDLQMELRERDENENDDK